MMLDNHQWKFPRWPWSKDRLNRPSPSFVHENERFSVDELAEKKLMEMLEEMKTYDGTNEIPWQEALPGPIEESGETVTEAEEQFMDDVQKGIGDVVGEMGGIGVLP